MYSIFTVHIDLVILKEACKPKIVGTSGLDPLDYHIWNHLGPSMSHSNIVS